MSTKISHDANGPARGAKVILDDNKTSLPPPVACTVTGEDYRQRRACISALTRDALQSYQQEGLVLNLRYARHAVNRVRELVARERQCCAFLHFELQEDEEQVTLTITAPELARGAEDVFFQPFISSPNSRAVSE